MDLAGRLPYRKRGQKKRHWLSMYAAKRLNYYLTTLAWLEQYGRLSKDYEG